MSKYFVSIREVYVSVREVEADTAEEALKSADNEDLDNEIALEYSHTLDRDTWTVEENS